MHILLPQSNVGSPPSSLVSLSFGFSAWIKHLLEHYLCLHWPISSVGTRSQVCFVCHYKSIYCPNARYGVGSQYSLNEWMAGWTHGKCHLLPLSPSEVILLFHKSRPLSHEHKHKALCTLHYLCSSSGPYYIIFFLISPPD